MSNDLEQVRQLMLSGYKWMNPTQRSLLASLVEGLRSFTVKRDSASYVERRRSVRLNCDYQVNCNSTTASFPGRVLDVGLTGLRLTALTKLPRGMTLSVVPVEGGGPVPCLVRWSRKEGDVWVAGVSFELRPSELVRSWVAVLLAGVGFNEEAVYQRRTAVRAPADLPAQLRSPTDDIVQGRVIDLGVGGALIQVTGTAPGKEGAHRVTLGPYKKLEMLSLNGQVVRISRPGGDAPLSPGGTDRWNLAVRFLEPNSAQVRLLGIYVLDLLSEGRPGDV
ncbi:MAG: PilZ domain-containing protein [Candidatus Eremiobacterota bacterium]